ncbi:MAG: glycosyltransferase family protein [Desulfuromonadaceae bacterium]
MIKIAFISQPEYFRFCYEQDLNDYYQVLEVPYNFDMGGKDFRCLVEYDADFNIFFRGEFIPNELLNKLSGVTICLSSEPFPRFIGGRLNFTFDSLVRYLHFRTIRNRPFDYVFHYDQASLPFIKNDGLQLSGAFHFPVATSCYKKIVSEPKWDLFFIGRSSSHRERYFSHMKHIYNFLHIAHGVWGPPLIEYISSSKICLNIHAENEVSWEPRMQMLLACGAFVISEKITPNSILRPNVDYIEISTPQELHQAIAYYLHHPEERKKISESAVERVHETLDSKVVFSSLITNISDNNIHKFQTTKCSSALELLEFIYNTTRRFKQTIRRKFSI